MKHGAIFTAPAGGISIELLRVLIPDADIATEPDGFDWRTDTILEGAEFRIRTTTSLSMLPFVSEGAEYPYLDIASFIERQKAWLKETSL